MIGSVRCFARSSYAVFVFVICIISCTKAPLPETEFVMGTICSVNLFSDGNRSTYTKIFSRLREIEEIFSANKAGTVMDEVNKNAGLRPVSVPPDFIYVLKTALYFAEKSESAFDPTIGPLVNLWNIGFDDDYDYKNDNETENENENSLSVKIPSVEDIDKALCLIAYRDVLIDETEQTVFLGRQEMRIDLGAIVKGYAADEVVRIAKECGVKSAVVDLGGNIYIYGTKQTSRLKKIASKSPEMQTSNKWKVGVQNPLKNRGVYAGYVEIDGGSLVTSGIYERFFEVDGTRYHHILSTTTGYPVENGIASVTIVNTENGRTDISMIADALSTTVFALGYDKGCKLLSEISHNYDVSAIFIMSDETKQTFGNVTLHGM
ncbi:FAD:protein FMN transferase [Spirochaetia bacterium]|nr:FAD:protein FMN transferase [Spirochaetia bacterium]